MTTEAAAPVGEKNHIRLAPTIDFLWHTDTKKKSQNLQKACLCNSCNQNTHIICDAEVYNPVLADVMKQITAEKTKEKKKSFGAGTGLIF